MGDGSQCTVSHTPSLVVFIDINLDVSYSYHFGLTKNNTQRRHAVHVYTSRFLRRDGIHSVALLSCTEEPAAYIRARESEKERVHALH